MPSRGLYSGSTGRSLFGVQGGYYGTGQDQNKWVQDAYKRLLSPDEFNKLDPLVRQSFGNYMGYLKAYTNARRLKQRAEQSYLQAREGTYQPAPIPSGTFGKGRTINTAGGGLPKASARIQRDMEGIPSLGLAGGGVRRTMSGGVIPATRGQGYLIPSIESQDDTEYLKKEASRLEAMGRMELPKVEAERRRLEQSDLKLKQSAKRLSTQERQADERIALERQRLEDAFTKQTRGMEQQEKMVLLNDAIKRDQMRLASHLRSGLQDDAQEFQQNLAILKGEVPGTEESLKRHAEIAARQAEIAEKTAELSNNMNVIKENRQIARDYRQHQFYLERLAVQGGLIRPEARRYFNTEAEANAANLPPGTRVFIGGRPAIIE